MELISDVNQEKRRLQGYSRNVISMGIIAYLYLVLIHATKLDRKISKRFGHGECMSGERLSRECTSRKWRVNDKDVWETNFIEIRGWESVSICGCVRLLRYK